MAPAVATATDAQVEDVVAGMDRLVMGLIDITEDIHTAVVWLAEHWSADLPAPAWFGRNEQTRPGDALRLLVYCDDDQLARVAELTGTVPVDDPAVDGLGNRYRRVRYPFGTGRVLLEAITGIDAEADR